MAHIVNPDREYHLLQQRLDRMVTGAPESPTLIKILKLLFSLEEAELARQIPSQPTSLDVLSDKLGIPRDKLDEKMTDMAQRGVVIDFQIGRHRYVALPPVVIGFFEYTFMRTRDEMPMSELARLFEQYMGEDDKFARAVFQGNTQLGRSLVREEALPEGDHTEILDWERASHIVQSAPVIGVSLCACRHKASHLGEACDRPLQTCLSLDYAAQAFIRSGFAQPITTDEAMCILEECKEAGLAQTADNVQRKVSYLCNCCGCCCGMIQAIKRFNLRGAIVTSNWIMEVDLSKCKGCGQCAEVCPVGAIEIREEKEGEKTRKWAVREEALCLGCGMCYSVCKTGGITMKPRAQRVFTPETAFDRTVSMAIERGKLVDLLGENPEELGPHAMGRIIASLKRSPNAEAAMAIEPLRSAFLERKFKKGKE